MATFKSDLSGKEFDESERIQVNLISHGLINSIQKDYPNINHSSVIALSELNLYREKYVSEVLISELGELNDLEKTVVSSISKRTILSNSQEEVDEPTETTFGQRVADKVASFGGSWKFIILFGVFILIWITANIVFLASKGFDPYPFILLNLILSCIAALQAPVIMMSQNRQEEKDRERAKKDYMINLKSELEIRMLHEKVDHLIMHQQKELLEIQQVQIDLLNSILNQTKSA